MSACHCPNVNMLLLICILGCQDLPVRNIYISKMFGLDNYKYVQMVGLDVKVRDHQCEYHFFFFKVFRENACLNQI